MAYPTPRPVKIKINSVDRTSSIPFGRAAAAAIGGRVPIIVDPLTSQPNTASFTVKGSGSMGLAGLQTVIISNVAEDVRYFAGVITALGPDNSRGPLLDHNIDCEDFGWYLDHPEVLIDKEYTGDSDQTIIKDFMADCCPNLEHDTHVDAVLASIDYIRFENVTPRAALERLAKMAGAEFYVDYGPTGGSEIAYLHYFKSGTNAAPHGLSDVFADPPVDPFPYGEFREIDRVPDVNAVEVVGRNASETRYFATEQDSEQGNLSYTGSYTFTDDTQDFAAWMEQGGVAIYRIIVTNSDGTESWAFLGGAGIQDTEQGNLGYTDEGGNATFTDDGQAFGDWDTNHRIYVTNSDGTLSWGYLGALVGATEVYIWTDVGRTVRGWNGAAVSGKTPSSYNVVQDAIQTVVSAYEELSLTTSGWNGDTITAKTPSSYVIWKAEGDYGYWIKHKIVDNDLITDTDLRQRGDQFLADVAAGVSYTCITWEPGLASGQDMTVVNAPRSLSGSLFIKRVTTTFDTNGYAEFALEMGAYIRRFADVLAGGRNVWDEEKFLPRRPGLIEQEDAGTDVQAQHDLFTYNDQTDKPSVLNLKKSHDDTLGTLTPTIDTEELAEIAGWGVESGSTGFKAATFKLIQRGAAGASSIDAEWQSDAPIALMDQEEMRFYEGVNYVGFEPPALSADQIWVLPDADGAVGEYLKTDGGGNLGWDAPPGGGDVVGPGAATDHAIARWDGAGGALLQDSGIIVDDSDNLVTPGTIELDFASGDPIIIFDTGGTDYFALGVDDTDKKFKLHGAGSLVSYSDFEFTHDETGQAGPVFEIIGAGTNSDPHLRLTMYCGTGTTPEGMLSFRKSHNDTAGTLTETVNADDLGQIWWWGVDSGSGWAVAAGIEAEQKGAAGAVYIPSTLRLWAQNNAGSENAEIELDGPAGDVNITVSDEVYIDGNCDITGTLSKGAGSFKIDHPLKPDTHWLYHSMIESPDMKNLYDGLARLDKNGMAWVKLPTYFKALNRNFRYQLTPIGKAMTMLYIADGVDGNRFLIAGGRANGLVSWQVTGIRQDTFANENRIQVEVRKTDD